MHLSFLWAGLVQNKGFPPPTSIHCSQKRHLIMAVGQLVLGTMHGRKRLFSLLHASCTAKRSCKVYNFPCFFNIKISRVCPLSLFFQPPSISCYHGEWNASSIQVVGWIGFEVDGWWESLIPPSPNTAPAWFLTFHLPETGSQREGAEKEAGSVLLRCSFSAVDEISSREKVLRTLVQSLVLKLAEAWMLTWVHVPASPKHPGKARFMCKSCSCLWLCFKGWCNFCHVKEKVRNEWIQCMLWQ